MTHISQKKKKELKRLYEHKISVSALTCLCPVRSSRKAWRFGGGPAPCVFCTLDKHACGEEGNYAPISKQNMKVQVLCWADGGE